MTSWYSGVVNISYSLRGKLSAFFPVAPAGGAAAAGAESTFGEDPHSPIVAGTGSAGGFLRGQGHGMCDSASLAQMRPRSALQRG